MREDAWLGRRLGRPAWTVEAGDAVDVVAVAGFQQAKVPCGDVARVAELQDAGFRVVDVNVTLMRPPGAARADGAAHVRDALPEDRDALLQIAARDLTVSRFHLDPRVGEDVAAAIKRDWVAAFFDGERGERLLVSVEDERPVGFLLVVAPAVIDLIAVARDRQGRGYGAALVDHLVALAADQPVHVGTQIANVGALRFYERLGFVVQSTRYVLHRHA